MDRSESAKVRIWFIELMNDDAERQYHVRLTQYQAEEVKSKLWDLVDRHKIKAFRMDPADEVPIPIESFRRRLSLDR